MYLSRLWHHCNLWDPPIQVLHGEKSGFDVRLTGDNTLWFIPSLLQGPRYLGRLLSPNGVHVYSSVINLVFVETLMTSIRCQNQNKPLHLKMPFLRHVNPIM